MPENPARRAETTRQSAYVDWLEELDVSEDNPSDWNLWPPNQTVAKGTKNLTEAGYISVSRTGLWSSASSRRSDHLSITFSSLYPEQTLRLCWETRRPINFMPPLTKIRKSSSITYLKHPLNQSTILFIPSPYTNISLWRSRVREWKYTRKHPLFEEGWGGMGKRVVSVWKGGIKEGLDTSVIRVSNPLSMVL